ncbi:hypothetical protein NQ318_023615 [Aromia moschata]|uniref:Double jelly roll-like domain-containing protein n=1 Tax=Aromia moschata TaxID=1265417 RepID=A0AAV8YP41_9CUCU|nr:hypothetical protein NQ318_023615 [Aromia moschata]
MDILNVMEQPLVDNSIVSWEYHNYLPYISSKFDYNDEIRIPIQELDAYTLPCESMLYLEGKLTKEDGNPATKLKLINNAFAFLFREIRFEMNGIIVDSNRNVGLTSTLKHYYLSFNEDECIKLDNAGWFPRDNRVLNIADNKFSVCIPLKMLMGFFEDYRKIILNMKQELVLIRSSDDIDSITSIDESEKPKIHIEKLYWRMPHILTAIPQQLALTKILEKNQEIFIPFRSWELVELPSLSENTRHVWPVKTSTKLETPRHIIIAFQTNKKNNIKSNMSEFNHCNLSNIRVFLNSERYPYNDLFLDFKNNKFATLYEMFSRFRAAYYEKENEPIFSPKQFKDIAPLVYIDCSRQKEAIQMGSVVLRVELETSENVPKNTTAYCLILHDRLFQYNPMTKIVKQV